MRFSACDFGITDRKSNQTLDKRSSIMLERFSNANRMKLKSQLWSRVDVSLTQIDPLDAYY